MPSIQMSTSINYLQLRVMSLVFDMMSSDTENFFTHLSIAGLDNFAPSPDIGLWLDWVGQLYGLRRLSREDVVESNDNYRRRILRMLSKPRENNTAIADIVGQSVGVWDILILDYNVFWALLIVFGYPDNPSFVLPLAKSIAPAGIEWTGIMIPGTTGDISGAIAGRVRAGNSGITYDSHRPNSLRRREGWSPDRHTNYWDDEIATPLSGVFAMLR